MNKKNKLGEFKYWLRLKGFSREQFGTGENKNPHKGKDVVKQIIIKKMS